MNRRMGWAPAPYRWFARLPVHRKLVVMALLVTTMALVLANLGLIVVDVWRYRTAAVDEVTSTARVIAENTRAAVAFDEPDAATVSLATVRVRPSVRRACLYVDGGALFAGYARSAEFACPPARHADDSWRIVTGEAAVISNDRSLGTVYVERDLDDLMTRVAVTAITGLVMLLIAGGAAFALAHRLHRTVSTPITRLAAAARSIRPDDPKPTVPAIEATDDELGDLVRAFTEMLRRVHESHAEREQLLAREREASRLKDEFLAAVSHELRTPLNAIIGWIQILTTTEANEQTTARAIASIGRNAKAQTRVIEDLVDVSRIVTGKLTLRFDPVDLREVIDAAVDAVRAHAEARQVRLAVELPAAVCLTSGDRDRLQQVVWNLLSNAVKFTPAGGTVALMLRGEGSTYEIEVRDTGAGITPSFLPHVFDRFRQADGSMTREHGGLGLGLAIVKELTELHGGSVSAASAGLGRGASFIVRLPQLAGLDVSPEQPPVRPAPPPLTGVRVVAVDDNADALEVIVRSLERRGAQVRAASGGREALALCEREQPDVLICDLAMPQMDGFDVLRQVRALDERQGRRTAAIALTAHASEEYRSQTRAAGFDAHVAKPYELSELERAVAAALERAS